jgi:hypothetical protein
MKERKEGRRKERKKRRISWEKGGKHGRKEAWTEDGREKGREREKLLAVHLAFPLAKKKRCSVIQVYTHSWTVNIILSAGRELENNKPERLITRKTEEEIHEWIFQKRAQSRKQLVLILSKGQLHRGDLNNRSEQGNLSVAICQHLSSPSFVLDLCTK